MQAAQFTVCPVCRTSGTKVSLRPWCNRRSRQRRDLCSHTVLNQGDRMNALATACLFGLAAVPLTVTASPAQKPMIVLVHGAFADASSWNKVIPMLQPDGSNVPPAQMP